MKPWELLDRTRTPGGTEVTLKRRDTEYVIFADGRHLMSSRMHGSEESMSALGCQHVRTRRRPTVLVGGLGMGFTLRATLDLLPADATVHVAELLPAVVAWNKGLLGPLAGRPLNDARVEVVVGDVSVLLRESRNRFDTVLLDVDNGPVALTASANATLYNDGGVAAMYGALAAGGVLAVWSAGDDREFERRLRRGGFRVDVAHVRGRLKKGPRHTIFVARKRG